MKGLGKLAWVEVKLFLREPTAAFFTLAFPLVMLLCFGSIFGNKPDASGWGFVDYSVPAYIALVVCMTGFFALTMRIAAYREQGILRRLRATPLQPHAVLSAQVGALLLMTVLGTLLLLVAGRAIYHMRLPGHPLSLMLAFLLSTLSFLAFGFTIAALTHTTRVAQVVTMVIFYPMMFFSGATVPVQVLPAGVKKVAQVLPLTHVVSLLQGLWFGDPWSKHVVAAAVLVGVMLAGTVVSAKLFRWE